GTARQESTASLRPGPPPQQRLGWVPCRRGAPLCPLPPDGISVDSRASANGPEFVQLPGPAVPYVNRRTSGVQASDQSKSRMADQLLNRGSATDLDTCHDLDNSHPGTVLSPSRVIPAARHPGYSRRICRWLGAR